MDPGSRRALLIAFVIAAIGLTACVVKTVPGHGHRYRSTESHEKHKKAKKPKKHNKGKHGHDD
jgi:hypothetical protein